MLSGVLTTSFLSDLISTDIFKESTFVMSFFICRPEKINSKPIDAYIPFVNKIFKIFSLTLKL